MGCAITALSLIPLALVLLNPRHSGLHPSKFPRPREGSRALDAVMLPLLDIEVTDRPDMIVIATALLRRAGHHAILCDS